MQHDNTAAPSSAVDLQSGKKKQVRKLKFFHGSGTKNGDQVMLCVMATSAAQCIELCEAAGLRGVNKGSIQNHWTTTPTPGQPMTQAMPVTDASVWAIEQHSLAMPVRLYPPQQARTGERLTRENLPANWPFPTVVFSKEFS